jgi:predicted membrane protein (TIGR00267 family)
MAGSRRRASARRPGIIDRTHDLLKRLRRYHEIADVGEIARRYFAMNAFDGVLTTVGVLTGSFIGGVKDSRAVISLIVATAVSMGVSGFYGSYLVERAERGRALKELEESTLSSLDDTQISAAARYATIVIAFVDGASPAAAAIVIMLPFFFLDGGSIHTAYYIGWAIAFVELFLLGMFLGHVSRERLVVSGIKLTVAGVISLGLTLLLNVAGV